MMIWGPRDVDSFLSLHWNDWNFHCMMTSSMKIFSALLALCDGNPLVPSHKGQWRRTLIVSLPCVWKKRLSTQSRRRWFETPSRPLSRHYNGTDVAWSAFFASVTLQVPVAITQPWQIRVNITVIKLQYNNAVQTFGVTFRMCFIE